MYVYYLQLQCVINLQINPNVVCTVKGITNVNLKLHIFYTFRDPQGQDVKYILKYLVKKTA